MDAENISEMQLCFFRVMLLLVYFVFTKKVRSCSINLLASFGVAFMQCFHGVLFTGKVDINGKVEHSRLLTPERKAPELKDKLVFIHPCILSIIT